MGDAREKMTAEEMEDALKRVSNSIPVRVTITVRTGRVRVNVAHRDVSSPLDATRVLKAG